MSALDCHHVGLTVSDLETCLAFYRDALGFPVLEEFSVDGEGFETAVGVPGASAEFVHLDAEGVVLELVAYEPEGAACAAETVAQPGAKHVGFTTPDLAAFLAGLPGDVETLAEAQTTPTGSTIVFLRDPEGNLLEVLER